MQNKVDGVEFQRRGKKNSKKFKFILPWWCKFIVYFIAISFMLVAITFTFIKGE